jgi:hypothetical protein
MAPKSSAQAASQPVGSWRFHAVRMVRQRSAGGCMGWPESLSTSTRARGSARCTRSMLRAAPKPPALSPASHTRRARGKVAATRRRMQVEVARPDVVKLCAAPEAVVPRDAVAPVDVACAVRHVHHAHRAKRVGRVVAPQGQHRGAQHVGGKLHAPVPRLHIKRRRNEPQAGGVIPTRAAALEKDEHPRRVVGQVDPEARRAPVGAARARLVHPRPRVAGGHHGRAAGTGVVRRS